MKKGLVLDMSQTVRELTCISCPIGCQLTVTMEEGKVVSVTGNTCPRGEVYAVNEVPHPVRTLTTTMAISNRKGIMLPVKSDNPIPKEKMMDVMKIVNATKVEAPVAIGQVLIPEVCEGCNIIAAYFVE